MKHPAVADTDCEPGTTIGNFVRWVLQVIDFADQGGQPPAPAGSTTLPSDRHFDAPGPP